MKELVLITGGVRSGKSRYALELGEQYENPYFLATATAIDDEMRERVRLHQMERGERFKTIEAPIDIASAIASVPTDAGALVVDCLTVWLGNLVHHFGMRKESFAQVDAFLAAVEGRQTHLIVVSNELGMGLVPESSMGRWFRDVAGRLNQEVAKRATRTLFMVSGYPLVVKDDRKYL